MTKKPSWRLEGMKAIADFLGCDVKTAYLWARRRTDRCPIYRNGTRGRCVARKAELRAWQKRQLQHVALAEAG